MGQATIHRGVFVFVAAIGISVLLVAALSLPRESTAALRRPIPRAANAVDQAAGAFEGLCDEVRDVIHDCRKQGEVTGAFGVYIVGIPLLAVEWQVELPPFAEEKSK
jgi:hypothetical protein